MTTVKNLEQTELLTWYLDSEWVCRTGQINADAKDAHSEFRVTLDYPEDYELMREIARRCHERQDSFYVTTATIVNELLNLNPSWTERPELWTNTRENVPTGLLYHFREP